MKSNIPYSKIMAGCMTWGAWGKQLSTAQMISLMEHCLAQGITTFDHADIYGDYTTEGQFGKALEKSGIDRQNIQLISKCGIQLAGGSRNNMVKHYEYNGTYIMASVERSLGALKTDYLDLLLLHRPSALMRPEEVAEAVASLKKQGKIRQFGVSNFLPSQIALLETVVPVEGNQVEFSLTHAETMYNGVLDDAQIHGRLAMAWSPLGDYFRQKDARFKRLQPLMGRLTKKYDATPDQLLLAWTLKHPAKIHPVVGTATPERLALSARALGLEMDLQDWFLLLQASQGQEVP